MWRYGGGAAAVGGGEEVGGVTYCTTAAPYIPLSKTSVQLFRKHKYGPNYFFFSSSNRCSVFYTNGTKIVLLRASVLCMMLRDCGSFIRIHLRVPTYVGYLPAYTRRYFHLIIYRPAFNPRYILLEKFIVPISDFFPIP